MAFANLSFETVGVGPGDAASWTFLSVTQGKIVAAFDLLPSTPWEDFENEWSSNENFLYAFVGYIVDLAQAEYATNLPFAKVFEDFEEKWSSNETYVRAFSGTVAVYDTTPANFEDFEQEWDSDESFLYEFVGYGTDLDVASFDNAVAEDFDGFESGWSDPYLFEFVGIGTDLDAADYDPNLYDDFESDWTALVMTTV